VGRFFGKIAALTIFHPLSFVLLGLRWVRTRKSAYFNKLRLNQPFSVTYRLPVFRFRAEKIMLILQIKDLANLILQTKDLAQEHRAQGSGLRNAPRRLLLKII